MRVQIEPTWEKVLHSEFEKEYFKNLVGFVKEEYKKHPCYPKGKDIFNAFDNCPFDEVKTVIIGQDPYHGSGQAHGLCFSVPQGIAHPPSLINIFKEVQEDLGLPYPKSGNLLPWGKQGVLLLNATLTVRAHQAGSHQHKGWEQFTDAVIQMISEKLSGVIFLLWGGFAKQKVKLINPKRHHVLTSGHPSPLSANKGYWFGNKHFSKCNAFLEANGRDPINWALE